MDGDRFDILARGFVRRRSRRTALRQIGLAGTVASLLVSAIFQRPVRALPARQAECPGGALPCGGVCVEHQFDPSNCGSCGHACFSDEMCWFGVCVPRPSCDGWQTLCGLSCVDLLSDPFNCGQCDARCEGWEDCVGGVCRWEPLAPCVPELTSCDDLCVDTQRDFFNCGGCGNVCEAPIETCRDGQCVPYGIAPPEFFNKLKGQ